MTQYWKPRPKQGSQNSLEGGEGECGETEPTEPDDDFQCLGDAYGTEDLAAGLGVASLAEAVVAVPDSQCVDSQFLPDALIDSPEASPFKKPDQIDQHGDPTWTDAQPRYPMVETSTEDSPKDVEVETPGSVSPKVPFDVSAPPQKFTEKDLGLVKARMEAIKSLSPFGKLYSFYPVHFFLLVFCRPSPRGP